MERKLLGTYECEKGIGRLYTGPMSDTPEKLRQLLEPAVMAFAKSVRKTNPEIIEEIAKKNAGIRKSEAKKENFNV